MNDCMSASWPKNCDIENWNRSLKYAVTLFKTSPATPVYAWHPYVSVLADFIWYANASLCHDRAIESATYFLRHLYLDNRGELVSEMHAHEYLAHIDERLVFLRENKTFRTPYAIRNIRFYRISAELLSSVPPESEVLLGIWSGIRKCYIPRIDEIPADIEWEV